MNMLKRLHFFVLVIWLAGFHGPVQAYPVEPNHPIYPFLRRMEIKYGLDGLFLNTLPLQRHEIQVALHTLEKHSTRLTEWERSTFQGFRKEFLTESRKEISRLIYQKEPRELMGSAALYTAFTTRDSVPSSMKSAAARLDLQIEGQFSNRLDFISSVTVGQERIFRNQFQENYDASRGMPMNTPGKTSGDSLFEDATFDAFKAVMAFHKNDLTLEIGTPWNQWGPGVMQHPALSQNSWNWSQDSGEAARAWTMAYRYKHGAPPDTFLYKMARRGYRYPGESAPLTMIRGTVAWDNLRYVKFMGKKTGLDYNTESWLTGHRLEYHYGRFTMGLYEMLCFTRSSMEWSYAVPFMSLFLAEHFTGDRDNVGLGMDFQYIFAGRYRFYGELFLDDLVGPAHIFDDFWGNKTSTVIGVEITDPFFQNSDLFAEYCRVDPWVYSHHLPSELPNNQFQSLGNLAGSLLPPNTHALYTRWTKHFMKGISAGAAYRFYQHQHHDAGSSIFDIFTDGMSTRKNFLGGTPETRHDADLLLSYEFHPYFSSEILSGYQWIENWKSRPGINSSGIKFSGFLTFKY